jgi:hypothetical protein
MSLSEASQKAIDDYLASLRRHLRDLMEEDMNDIVEEIGAHILDKASAGANSAQVEETLAALGPPAALAARYRTEEMMRRAEAHRSGAQKTRIAVRAAGVTLATLLVVAVSGLGYFVGGVLVVIGIAKLMWPHGTGLWENHNPDGTWGFGLSGGSGNTPPANSHDLLGWWLLPIGLILGPALIYATFRLGKWSVKKMWRPKKWQQVAGEPQAEI